MKLSIIICQLALMVMCAVEATCFSAFVAPNSRTSVSSTCLQAKMIPEEDVGRRQFASQIMAKGLAIASAASVLVPSANALGLNKMNAQLQGYGLPPLKNIPDGFTGLLQLYGKARNRTPLLVEFVHPFDWVVTLPNIDKNGEEGTIQAGEYAKGDTATLYVYNAPGRVNNVAEQPKSFYEEVLFKALTQKGDNLVQSFKLGKVEPVKRGDQDYVLVDFKYELLTGAGFTVDRKGVASITSQGNAVQALWSASIAARYKKTEPQLRTIVDSFRCYADGLQFSLPEEQEFD